ncbi:MAG: GGDEF domain-containing protein [Candidatus Aminicenantes bacterium]|nr:GGDEF domain-containing protein [Candidatus Aminicenantes bacterium]
MNMNDQEISEFPEPDRIHLDINLAKTRWLIRIRWIYSFFILVFFIVHTFILNKIYINFPIFFFILFLSILGNVIFILYLKKKGALISGNLKLLAYLVAIQLAFDFMVLFLYVIFSGGFESPVLVLFIFYILVSTFVIHHKKALLYTIATVILITAIFFLDQGLVVSSSKLANLVTFDILLVFSFLISSFLSSNMKENEILLQRLFNQTRELSITDGLTLLYNQTYFFERLQQEIQQSKRYKYQLSVIILDVDDFKKYNDANGHIYGSKALKQIGSIMKKMFRSSDILAKYGGDEFVVMLPHTDKVGAFLAADRLREIVEQESFGGEESLPRGKITLSLGVTSFPDFGDSVEEVLSYADKALYHAKKLGRNRTILYSEEIEENKS